jgi:UTP-glucose-1-phosphate uridylyltransferase
MDNNTRALFGTLQRALDHIKEVQTSVTALNLESMTMLGDAIFAADVEISEDGFVALQHQDILTQQLSATSELIEMISKHINESSDEALEKNISAALEVAKAKKDAFSGNAFNHKHEDIVELF